MYDPIDEQDVYLETQRLAVMASVGIENAMTKAGLRRSDLATRLDVPRSRISQALDGETNMTLKTLAQFGLACGVRWQFVGVDAVDAAKIVVAPPSLGLISECEFVVEPVGEFSMDSAAPKISAVSSPADSNNYELAA